MGDRVKGVATKAREAVGKLPKAAKRGIIAGLIVLVALIIGLNIYNATRPYVVLFTELSSEDMALVLGYLNESGVADFQVVNDDTILVREGDAAALKAAIYQQGYPTSGFGYGTYLNNVGILTSETDRQTLQLYELMDRLSSTVKQMDGVKDAWVNIAQGSTSSYLLSANSISATASVTVEMQTGRTLSGKQVTAIRNMISRAVSGLEITNIEIHDTVGNNYTDPDESASLSDAAEIKLALEVQQNERVRNAVLAVLAPMFGVDNVTVSVNSSVDTSHTYSESLHYIEPQWAEDGSSGGEGIIGKWVWDSGLVRGDGTTAGGVVGTSTNADLNEYIINRGDLTGDETQVGMSGERDYLVSQERTQSENQGGILTDMMVAVAINSNVIELSETQVDQLVPVVARAAGVSAGLEAEKIAIIRYPFHTSEEPGGPGETESWLGDWWPFPEWMFYAIVGGVLLLILLLVVFLVLRGKKKKKEQEAAALAAAQAQAEAEARALQLAAEGELMPESEEAAAAAADAAEETGGEGADIMDLNTERTMELRQNVRQFAELNPAIAAQMLRTWLKGGENGG